MVFALSRSSISTVWIVLSVLACAISQEIQPSNSTTLPVDPSGPQLIISVPLQIKRPYFTVDPLTNAAGLHNALQQLQAVHINGPLILTNESTFQTLQSGNIAYISCEPSDYVGNIGIKGLVKSAAEKIAPASNVGGAIVLYSTVSSFCTFDASGGFMYASVYTMINSTQSMTLKNGLQIAQPAPIQQSIIFIDPYAMNNNTSNTDALGPSPTTAVAMIILYSITGIITALFLVIIVTGAIRAHRHPERYGPRQIIGRPRQSRARGIARAMLETIPIVKFGEREEEVDKNVPHEGDVELGTTSERNTPSTDPSRNTSEPSSAETRPAGQENAAGDEVTTVTADGIGASHITHEGTPESSTENGLACSVCTDDFVKGQDIRLLPCNHKFHPECIDPWLLNVSGTCPLCRVDLRPTTSNADPSTNPPISPNPYLAGPAPNSTNPSTSPTVPATSTTDSSRRRSGGLALYIHHTLNARRMRDATPDERIAALRRVRTVGRASGEAQREEGGLAVGERTVRRVQGRLSRLWDLGVVGGAGGRHSAAETGENGVGSVGNRRDIAGTGVNGGAGEGR